MIEGEKKWRYTWSHGELTVFTWVPTPENSDALEKELMERFGTDITVDGTFNSEGEYDFEIRGTVH